MFVVTSRQLMCHSLCDIWLLVISFSCDVLTGTLVVVRLIVRGEGEGQRLPVHTLGVSRHGQ